MNQQYFKNQAAALIFSIAALAVLSLTAVAWTKLAMLHQAASENLNFQSNARLMAYSGIDYTIASLRQALKDNSINAKNPAWNYPDSPDTPISQCSQCSLAKGIIRSDAGQIPVSGVVRLANLWGSYTLKVIEHSSRIYINGSICFYNSRMINNLAKALRNNGKGPDLIGTEGDEIFASRPRQGYQRLDDLVPVLGQKRYDQIYTYLTVHARLDPTAIKANMRGGNSSNGYRPEIMSLYAFPQAPINVNTASAEVLTAVFADLKGCYIEDENRVLYPNDLYAPPASSPGDHTSISVNFSEAMALSAKIVEERQSSQFTSWQQFYHFLQKNTSLFEGDISLQRLKADVIFANCNPNADCRWGNPNASWASLGNMIDTTYGPKYRFRGADKFDLYWQNGYNMQLCFTCQGIFTIESLGRIWKSHLSGNYRQISEHRIRTTVKIFDLITLTSQADFEGGYNPPDLSSKVPGRVDVNLAGPAIKYQIATYPEPDPRHTEYRIPQYNNISTPAIDLSKSAAIYDGQLMLATRGATACTADPYLYAWFNPQNKCKSERNSSPVIDRGYFQYPWTNQSWPASDAYHLVSSDLISFLRPVSESGYYYCGYESKRLCGHPVSIPRFHYTSHCLVDGAFFGSIGIKFYYLKASSALILDEMPGPGFTIIMWHKPGYDPDNSNVLKQLIKTSRTTYNRCPRDYRMFPTYMIGNITQIRKSNDRVESTLYFTKPLTSEIQSLFFLEDLAINGQTNSSYWNASSTFAGKIDLRVAEKWQRGQWYFLAMVVSSVEDKKAKVTLYSNNTHISKIVDYDLGKISKFNLQMLGTFLNSYPAASHATIDELQIYPYAVADSIIKDYRAKGRYYSSGIYLSPRISLKSQDRVTWNSLSWNGFCPGNSKIKIRGYIDPQGAIVEEQAGGIQIQDVPPEKRTPDFQGQGQEHIIDRQGQTIQLLVQMEVADYPPLDTPVLDDINICYYPHVPEILAWE